MSKHGSRDFLNAIASGLLMAGIVKIVHDVAMKAFIFEHNCRAEGSF